MFSLLHTAQAMGYIHHINDQEDDKGLLEPKAEECRTSRTDA